MIKRRTAAGPSPLSFSQERLWFLDQLTPGTALYNIPVAARFDGELDTGAFRGSINEILRRHEILRTYFPAVAGRPVQEVATRLDLDIPVIDLRAMASGERETEARRLAAEESVRPFDLARGPLLRVTLVRLEDANTVILFTVHHIVFDEWSLGIFMRELGAIYDAYSHGATPALPEPRLQYADYAAWQRHWLESEVLEAQLAYWRAKLDDVPVLELPSDYARPAMATHRGASQPIHIPAPLTRALRELGKRRGCTIFMTLLAAFKVLLARYSTQTDFAVGIPIANRNHAGTQDIIGFFVNTLVLRTDLGGSPTFVQVLARVRETALGAYAHQDLPFVTLVEKLQPERALSHNPLFQVIFQLIAAPDRANTWESQLSTVQAERQTAIFDLTFGLEDRGETLDGAIVYSTDLFSAPAMARIAGHFVTLLESIVQQPSRRISDLALMSTAEQRDILRTARSAGAVDLPPAGVHDLVAEQVRRDPHAAAVAFDDASLTYGELARRANRLASYLRASGVGPEVPVAVALPRSATMIAAWLAILQAGGAYAPIDLDWPAARIRAVLSDTGARLLIANTDDVRLLDAELGSITLVDVGTIPECDGADGAAFASPDQLAAVLYTSGSTGAPKGIGVTHRAIHRLIAARFTTIRPGDRIAQASNCSFDAATFEIWCALAKGATVCGIPHDVLLSPEDLGKRLEQDRITHLFLTTALFNEAARTAPDAFRSVREVLFGGEAADLRSVEQILAAKPPARLVHVYGPTENTTFSTFYDVKSAHHPARLPIGEPLQGTDAYILGPDLELVPAGVAGELCLGGEGLARGYVNRPALTAEAFVPHPYSAAPGARLYRTGDRARLLPSGALEFLGRRDTQVKLRGYRIELQEIEAVLLRHPDVREAAIAVVDSGPKGRRLVAYIAQKDGIAITAGVLRTFLKQSLPDYMAPAEFVFLDRLPLNATGKVNRAALPPPQSEMAATAGSFNDAPRTETEERLAALWASLLQRDRIGIYDNFFELGGHSLMATHLIARVRAQLQVEIPLRGLFESPTVAGFAERIEEVRRNSGGERETPNIAATRVDADPPASFAQARIWFMDRLGGRKPLFNIPHAFRIEGPINPEALEWALGEVIRRHEPLRTRFSMRSGALVQVIEPHQRSFGRIEIHDLEALPEPKRGKEIQRHIEAEKRRLFDLESDIPIRCQLLREGVNRWTLLLTLHHIAFDSVSEGILFRELSTLYSAFCHNLPSPLEDLPVQYSQYAIWQKEWLKGAALDRELAFWKTRLDGVPPLELPFAKRAGAAASGEGASAWLTLSEGTADALRRLAQTQGCTLFMALLAGFQALLRRVTGQCDIAVGTPVGSRPADAESLIGFFVNMVVLRGDVSGNPAFRDVLARVRATTLEMYEHQDAPFDKIVESVQPVRRAAGSPLFKVVVALQKNSGPGFQLEGVSIRRLDVTSATAKYDMTLVWLDAPAGLTATLEYDTGVLDHDEAAKLLEMYSVLLDAAARAPDTYVAALPLISPGERTRLIEEFAHAPGGNAPPMAISEAFEDWVRKSPNAVAVTGVGGELTYAELNRRANALAAVLADAGVRRESLVALYIQRSAAMIVAMLGALKAGAAYLPLEPSDPPHRTALILRDAGVDAIVTQADLKAALSAAEAPIVVIDAMTSTDAAPPAITPRANGLAYVMYTSGSTGVPKGVEVTHQGVTGLLREAEFARLGTDICILQSSPCGFDASTFEIWGALLNGGRVALMPPGSLDDIACALRDYRVTTAWLTAALFHQMVEDHLDSFAGLRLLLAGGDVLSPEHVRAFVDRYPNCDFVNGYGPTEATVFATCYPVGQPPRPGTSTPIGRPVGGAVTYVLDEELQPAPIGIPGLLYVAGPRLARGYHRRPGLTAASWIPDPFSKTPGARMYATGDVVRWLADGNLEFLGRRDRQVKIRGYRVELGELEALLAGHPAVCQAAALALPDDNRLAAFVVLDPASQGNVRDIAEHIRSIAPSFLAPSAITALDRLPTTPNGKVDYRALEALQFESAPVIRAGAPPCGPLQELVADVWRDVFDIDAVHADDNFFDLGGHSLLAMRVASRLRGVTGRELPLRMLFEAPTVAQLAIRLASLSAGDESVGEAPVERVSRDVAWPLSPRQEVVWRGEQTLPRTPLFTIGTAVRLRGPLQRDAVARAIDELATRHESLRTRFIVEDGRPLQRVDAGVRSPVEWIDLGEYPQGERESRAAKLAAQILQCGFDLAEDPPWRVAIITLGREDHVIAVALHHIAADGWSMNVLAREFDSLYRAYSNGHEAASGPAAVDYIDCCEAERLALASRPDHLAYWTTRLAGAIEPLGIPTDYRRPAPVLLETARARFVFSNELTQQIARLARNEGVTRFMALLAIYQLALHQLSGNRTVRVGAPFANRSRLEYEDVVGLFTNTVILNAQFAPAQTFRELLHQVRETVLGAEAHQSIPFERVADALANAGADPSALFETMFLYQNSAAQATRLGDALLLPFELDRDAMRGWPMLSSADFILEVKDGPGRIRGSLIYRPDLFNASTMRRWLRRFRVLAAECVSRPGEQCTGPLSTSVTEA